MRCRLTTGAFRDDGDCDKLEEKDCDLQALRSEAEFFGIHDLYAACNREIRYQRFVHTLENFFLGAIVAFFVACITVNAVLIVYHVRVEYLA